MSEAELCLKLEEYFSEWEIYKEVPNRGGRCDMYVKKGCLWVSIEVKKQFSCLLIQQALTNMPNSHYSYVAVPDLKGSYPAIQICKRLGIGVLVYRTEHVSEPHWCEVEKPFFKRKIVPMRVLPVMKLAAAGVQHNTMSEFKVSLSYIEMHIKRNGGRMPIKEVFENNKYHYSSSKSAAQCITKLCRKGAIKEFYLDGKDLVLTNGQELTYTP